ncbi:MAG: hypothetical protein ABSH56_22345 [Bryobacteraceae bacterium]|jgi:hypothetical protein
MRRWSSVETEKTKITGRFAEAGCSSVEFHFRAARDKFKLEDFSAWMQAQGMGDLPQRWGATCRTQFPETADYHVHFGWNESEKKDLDLWVSYCSGSAPLDDKEREPYAEQFMRWLGQFFVGDYANADLQGRISYPIGNRQSRYLLPVKVGIIPGLDTTIDGISIDFPSRPSGIGVARLTSGVTQNRP